MARSARDFGWSLAAVSIVALGVGATKLLTQTVTSCTVFNFSPSSAFFPAAGGTGSVTCSKGPQVNGVYTGCAWVASSNAPWITIISGGASDNTGFGIVRYSVAANASVSRRSGTITFSSGDYGSSTYTITQDGTTAPPPPSSARLAVPKLLTYRYNLDSPSEMPVAQQIPVVSRDGESSSFTASVVSVTPTGAPWLFLDRSSGVTPTSLRASVQLDGLRPGIYVAYVAFSTTLVSNTGLLRPAYTGSAASGSGLAAGGVNEPRTAIVAAVGPNPVLTPIPDQIDFDDTFTSQRARLGLSSGNLNVTPLASILNGPTDWLSVTPNALTAPGSVTIGASPSGLTPDVYEGLVTFGEAGGSTAQVIRVRYHVGQGQILESDQDALAFEADQSGNSPPPQEVTVTTPSDAVESAGRRSGAIGPSDVIVSSDGGWLSATPGTISRGVVTVSANPAGLSPGPHIGSISIVGSGIPNSPLVLPVIFNIKDLPDLTSRGQPLMAQIVDGGSWKTTITLVNNDTAAAPFTLAFYGDDGSELTLPLEGGTTARRVAGTIPAGGSRTFATPGTGSILLQGWAELSTPANVGGLAIFRQRLTRVPDTEAASPLTFRAGGKFLLPFDNSGGFVTGMALVNPSTSTANVNVRIRDLNGATIGTGFLNLPARGHTAFALTDRFAVTGNRVGTVEVGSASSGLAGLGLRFDPGGAFTSFPVVVPRDLDPPGSRKLIAQIADGEAWKTTLLLVNADTVPANIDLTFHRQDGSRLALPFEGIGTTDALTGRVPAASVDSAVTTGTERVLAQGWSEVVTGARVGGLAIFRQRVSGRPDFEAASPLVGNIGRRFLLPFDNTQGFVTGIALVSPSNRAVTVQVSVRDENGLALASPSIPLPAFGQTAFALPDRISAAANRRGVIEFSCATGVSGLGLRFNPSGAFTSLPILVR